MMTLYRSKAMAVMLMVDTKMEVACKLATSLQVTDPLCTREQDLMTQDASATKA